VIWIAQCLCPQRHCILACAGEVETETLEVLQEGIENLLAAQSINPWCGLCGATKASWKYEVARSRFRTMEEALPGLREEEERQRLSAAVWSDIHRAPRRA
jgi:hypothetical protein